MSEPSLPPTASDPAANREISSAPAQSARDWEAAWRAEIQAIAGNRIYANHSVLIDQAGTFHARKCVNPQFCTNSMLIMK